MAVMIRSPLSRMQSAWYAARLCDNHAICTEDCQGESFQADLWKAISNAKKKPPVYTEWLWTSMYRRHLKEWLVEFSASQFYVIPYMEYTSGKADAICKDLSGRLDFEMHCDSKGVGVSHDWPSEHPSLKKDLTPELREAFDSVMEEENAGLVGVLAAGNLLGMGLAGYSGKTGSLEETRQWLHERW